VSVCKYFVSGIKRLGSIIQIIIQLMFSYSLVPNAIVISHPLSSDDEKKKQFKLFSKFLAFDRKGYRIGNILKKFMEFYCTDIVQARLDS
jgi:hypothetical protein